MLALETQRIDIGDCLLGTEIHCKDIHGEIDISFCKRYNVGENILHTLKNEKRSLNVSRSCSDMIHCGSENHVAVIQMLVLYYKEYSVETMEKCLTLLALNSALDTIKWLWSIGIDILKKSAIGENILCVAIKRKNFSLVDSLLQKKKQKKICTF